MAKLRSMFTCWSGRSSSYTNGNDAYIPSDRSSIRRSGDQESRADNLTNCNCEKEARQFLDLVAGNEVRNNSFNPIEICISPIEYTIGLTDIFALKACFVHSISFYNLMISD